MTRNWAYHKGRVEKLREMLAANDWDDEGTIARLEAQSSADAMSAKLRELEPEYHFLSAHPEAIADWEAGVPFDWLIEFVNDNSPRCYDWLPTADQ